MATCRCWYQDQYDWGRILFFDGWIMLAWLVNVVSYGFALRCDAPAPGCEGEARGNAANVTPRQRVMTMAVLAQEQQDTNVRVAVH